jgi:phosphatidylserine decarboxylase
MKISKEGRVVIPVALIILAALAGVFILLTYWAIRANGWFVMQEWFPEIVAFWSLAALVTWGFVVAFFRIPDRPILSDDGVIFAPCDGRVVVAEDVDETEVLGDRRIQVSIFMSITNVHMNWFPAGGRVTYFKHHNGRFMVAWHPKSSDDNERTTTAVETPRGPIVFRQVAGLVARRIVSYAQVGETAVQNTPCGFIKFGSRVDLYLPPDAELLVSLGQKVRGSQTPVARFPK